MATSDTLAVVATAVWTIFVLLSTPTCAFNPGDITTVEDEGSVEEARQAWHQMRAELNKV